MIKDSAKKDIEMHKKCGDIVNFVVILGHFPNFHIFSKKHLNQQNFYLNILFSPLINHNSAHMNVFECFG